VCVDGPSVSGAVKIPCSQPHTWRAATTIVLGRASEGYPGDQGVEARTRDFCSDSIGAWMNYPVDYDFGYTWFHEAEWEAGNRRSVCWARTEPGPDGVSVWHAGSACWSPSGPWPCCWCARTSRRTRRPR